MQEKENGHIQEILEIFTSSRAFDFLVLHLLEKRNHFISYFMPSWTITVLFDTDSYNLGYSV